MDSHLQTSYVVFLTRVYGSYYRVEQAYHV
jgi:hypothetical protein